VNSKNTGSKRPQKKNFPLGKKGKRKNLPPDKRKKKTAHSRRKGPRGRKKNPATRKGAQSLSRKGRNSGIAKGKGKESPVLAQGQSAAQGNQ